MVYPSRSRLPPFVMYCSIVSPCDLVQQRIADSRRHVAAPFSALGHDIGHTGPQDQVFALHHIDKAHRHADDQRRMQFTIPDQRVQLDQGCGRIADGKNARLLQRRCFSMETIAR